MAADPADIALYTTEGVIVYSPSNPAVGAAILAVHIDAQNLVDTQIETFFDSATDAQVLLDEAWAILSTVNPASYGIEIDDTLGLGSSLAVTPTVPCFTIVDDVRGTTQVARVRAYTAEYGSDRFAVEMLGGG